MGTGGENPQSVLQISPEIPTSGRGGDFHYHGRIVFEQNTVRTFDSQVIYALSADRLEIRDNRFTERLSADLRRTVVHRPATLPGGRDFGQQLRRRPHGRGERRRLRQRPDGPRTAGIRRRDGRETQHLLLQTITTPMRTSTLITALWLILAAAAAPARSSVPERSGPTPTAPSSTPTEAASSTTKAATTGSANTRPQARRATSHRSAYTATPRRTSTTGTTKASPWPWLPKARAVRSKRAASSNARR